MKTGARRPPPGPRCYCGSLDRASLAEEGIPEGYCGLCEVCGAPGHTQHHPGGVPYTGSWCDTCLAQVAAASRWRSLVPALTLVLFLALFSVTVMLALW